MKKGDLLVQLDKEPFQVQLAIKQAAVVTAEADLAAAEAQVRGLEAWARRNAGNCNRPWSEVASQIATLRANVATYESKRPTWSLSRANLKRGEQLAPSGGISKEELDVRRQAVKVGRGGRRASPAGGLRDPCQPRPSAPAGQGATT